MLVLHFRSLEVGDLASWVYAVQQDKGWPGLAAEVKEICEELQIESCNTTRMSTKHYRQIVTKACHVLNEKWLPAEAEGKEKCTKIQDEQCGKSAYISQNFFLKM